MKNNDDHIQTFSDYIQYFAPDFTLHPDVSTKQENLNTKQVHLEISLSHFDTARLEGKYYWIKITLKEKNKFENPTLCVCIVNAWDLTLPVLLCLFEQYLDNVKATVHEHLRNLINSPSVQMQDIPPDLLSLENTEEHDPDIRNHQDQTDKRSVRIELHVFYNEISGFST